MLNQNVVLYGHETLPPESLVLRAGDLTMEFEPDTAFLRYIRRGDEEIVRCVYAVVRDGNWNTIPWQVRGLRSEARADSFEITFEVECSDGTIQYSWRGAIAGTADGQVTFVFDGEAKTDFLRNRIGICVLHPGPEFGGKACTVEHTNGVAEKGVFPKLIAPWQPLKDVRAITTDLEQGVSATVRLEGDVFETEDQRNYGDASFKTYSTPQDLPKPVQVRAGDAVRQRVIVSVSNPQHQPLAVKVRNKPPHISATGETMPKPNIGLQAARQAEAMSDIELQRVRDLALGHLRADIFLAQPEWKSQLKLISEEANRLAVPLHLVLHVGAAADTEMSEFARASEGQNLRVALWIVQRRGESFPSAQTLELARRTLAAVGEKAPLAGAASPFFTEFNRNRPGDSDALVCYPLAPQVHLTDRTTVMENIADVAETIHSAHALTGRPVVVSPITLRRAEPKASRTTAADALPGTVDERQISLFAAAWTVGHLSYLCGAAGLHSATFFETIGWRGVMESIDGSPLPAKFFSIPGSVFPVYHVFADVAPFDRVRRTRCTRPLEAVGVTLVGAKGQRTLVANLLPRPQEVTVALEASYARVRRLNAATAEEAMRTPESFRKASSEKVEVKNDVLALHLAAYEVVTIDV